MGGASTSSTATAALMLLRDLHDLDDFLTVVNGALACLHGCWACSSACRLTTTGEFISDIEDELCSQITRPVLFAPTTT